MKSCLIRTANGQQDAFRFSTPRGFYRQVQKLYVENVIALDQLKDYKLWFHRGHSNVSFDGNIHFEVTQI